MEEEDSGAPSKEERRIESPGNKATKAPAPEKTADSSAASGKSMYHYIGEAWKDPNGDQMHEVNWQRLVDWRKEGTYVRVKKPTRLDKARSLGYRAKQGFVVVRVKVRKGGLRKHRIRKGRRPKRKGVLKITMRKNIQRIAEERMSKKYPNLEVLASYWVGEDGRHKWFEVIGVDPSHPVIKADPKINWICSSKHTHRAIRGLTPAGKKGRGLVRTRGSGAEKVRPSLGAHNRKGT